MIHQAFTFDIPLSNSNRMMMTCQSLHIQHERHISKIRATMMIRMRMNHQNDRFDRDRDHDHDDTVFVSRRKVLSNVKQSMVVPYVAVMIQSWQPISTLPVNAIEETSITKDDETTLQLKQLKNDIKIGFQQVRNELLNDNGGIHILQQYMNNQDYNSILEYTKTYDQIIRKGMIGKTKKLIVQYIKFDTNDSTANSKINEQRSKIYNDRIIQIGNDITFDLIGINRNARSGQESISNVNQYLSNLQNDLQEFLKIESELFSE
jgi:hypothetical protein